MLPAPFGRPQQYTQTNKLKAFRGYIVVVTVVVVWPHLWVTVDQASEGAQVTLALLAVARFSDLSTHEKRDTHM